MVLIVSAGDVGPLLPMRECIAAVERGLLALESGAGAMPLRFGYKLPQDEFSVLASMPAYLEEPDGSRFCCNKCITVFPGNVARGKHSHQGAIMLFEATSGSLLAIIDASEVTAVRTAAASAVATRLLANPETPHLALIGSGAQAGVHLEAMLLVRPSIRRVTVWSRTESRLRLFVEGASKRCGGRGEEGRE